MELIIGAKVTATMSLGSEQNGTDWNLLKPMPLYDNGFGDHDIVEGKVIYRFIVPNTLQIWNLEK